VPGPFTIDAADPTPIYAQLDRAIRAAVATGRLKAGDQLPTVRQLAVELKLNANTVARVYGELEQAGVLETRRGVGTFVTERPPEPAHGRQHKQHLRAFAERVRMEAAARGFSVPELLEQLEAAHKKGA
jgi:GntR family transcriptional regulator